MRTCFEGSIPRFFCHSRFDAWSGMAFFSESGTDAPRFGDGPREMAPLDVCCNEGRLLVTWTMEMRYASDHDWRETVIVAGQE